MKRFLIAILCLAGLAYAADIGKGKVNPSDVRIIPVKSTPEPDNVKTTIVFPQKDQVLGGGAINVQVRLLGYPVGTTSDFDRKNEVYNDPNGQSLLVFIDNEHPIEIYKSFIDSLDNNNLFYSLTLTTQIPFPLDEGMHVIRTFPDRSYGESLKDPGAYAAQIFYIGQEENNLDVNLNAPYLTYNEPLETLTYTEKKPFCSTFTSLTSASRAMGTKSL
jgi:hypothetical protein